MNSRCTPHNATGAAGAGTSSRPFRRTSLLINWRAVMARRFWPLSGRYRNVDIALSASCVRGKVGGVSGACSALQCGENRAWNGGACCLRFVCGRNEHSEVGACTAPFANPARRSGWKPRTLPLSGGNAHARLSRFACVDDGGRCCLLSAARLKRGLITLEKSKARAGLRERGHDYIRYATGKAGESKPITTLPDSRVATGPRSTCAVRHCLAARCGNLPGPRAPVLFLGVWHE